MRRPLAVVLLMLAIPMMGSDCSVAARVGGPPPPPPPDGEGPPRDGGGGGGVIVVTSGGSAVSSRTTGVESLQLDRSLVASAIAASVWTAPRLETDARLSERIDPSGVMLGESIPSEDLKTDSMLPVDEKEPAVAAAVPEPTGSLLFGCGLGLAAGILRPSRARG